MSCSLSTFTVKTVCQHVKEGVYVDHFLSSSKILTVNETLMTMFVT